MADLNKFDSEHELLIRLINGDEEAFCDLYASYKNRLLYYSMKFVKSKDFAEDIFHDAFTIIWQSRKFIDPNSSFSSYLYTIVRNRILNQLRNMENDKNFIEHIKSNAIDSIDSVNDDLLLKDLNFIIDKAMYSLTERQREIFNLSRNAQMSHKEIAEKLGISVNTVQEHISASLRVIRTFLSKYSDAKVDLLLILICINS